MFIGSYYWIPKIQRNIRSWRSIKSSGFISREFPCIFWGKAAALSFLFGCIFPELQNEALNSHWFTFSIAAPKQGARLPALADGCRKQGSFRQCRRATGSWQGKVCQESTGHQHKAGARVSSLSDPSTGAPSQLHNIHSFNASSPTSKSNGAFLCTAVLAGWKWGRLQERELSEQNRCGNQESQQCIQASCTFSKNSDHCSISCSA